MKHIQDSIAAELAIVWVASYLKWLLMRWISLSLVSYYIIQVHNDIYLSYNIFLSHAVLPAPGVSVRDEGSAVVGSNHSLFCEVAIPPLLPLGDIISLSLSYIIWTHLSGETQQVVGNSSQLAFSPLTSDDEGVYTCTAHYSVSGIRSPQGSCDHDVTFSKCVCVISVCYLNKRYW